MKKFFALTASFLFVLSSLQALPFNSKLEGDELAAAERGEVVIRNISSYKRISLDCDIPEVNEYLEDLRKLDPHYFVEVFQVRKASENGDVSSEVADILSQIESYTSIPYYSEYNNATAELFSFCKVYSDRRVGQERTIRADMTMPPFKCYSANIGMVERPDFLLYKSTNVTDMYCIGFVRVKKDCLRSVITVFRDGENWIIYGIGVAKAPKIPLLTARIETAFISRVKSFCKFATDYLDKKK